MANLTIKQKKFCDLYMKSGNATQSYMSAGYATKGDGARVEASKLLTKPNIKEYIAKKQAKIENKRIMSIQEAQEFLTNIANTDKERTNDKLKAVELLVKMQGGFLDRLNVNADVSLNYEDKLKEIEDNEEF